MRPLAAALAATLLPAVAGDCAGPPPPPELRAAPAIHVAAAARAPIPISGRQALVVRGIDGDTLEVKIGSRRDKVRLIGVDAPESVHPRRPVERFALEAAMFTRRMTVGKVVTLVADDGQLNRDKYGRLLRYVFLADGTCVNAEIIRQGYGHAYVRFPFDRIDEFRALERQARAAGRGLWTAPREAGARSGRHATADDTGGHNDPSSP